jgi:hypothetical protein
METMETFNKSLWLMDLAGIKMETQMETRSMKWKHLAAWAQVGHQKIQAAAALAP